MRVITETQEGYTDNRRAILDCIGTDGHYDQKLGQGLVKAGLVPDVHVTIEGDVVLKDTQQPGTLTLEQFTAIATRRQTLLAETMADAYRLLKMRNVWQELGRW